MSEVLRLSSAAWSLLHVLVLFLFFYSSRLERKKTLVITLSTWVPLIALNLLMLYFLGQDLYGKLMLLTLVVPSFLFFFLLAKHRDCRFLFTFCLADTISMEVIVLSMILNYYITPQSNIVMFLIRILGFPAVEYFAVKFLRKPYFEVQSSIKKGWGVFSLVSIIFYALIVAMVVLPVNINQRPEDMPLLLIILLLMPLMYFNIFQILAKQRKLHRVEREQELWIIQSAQMQRQLRQLTEGNDLVRRERHDLRHRLSAIDMLLQKGEIAEARAYISTSLDALVVPTGMTYCKDPVLDAIFSYYFKLAQDNGIRVEHMLSLPQTLPVEAAELSVVLANAIENAIHACQKLPARERVISCKCIASPQFMLQIRNPYTGHIHTDEAGIPVDPDKGHGIGTRSILAFCEKYGALADYKIENGVFALRIVIQR